MAKDNPRTKSTIHSLHAMEKLSPKRKTLMQDCDVVPTEESEVKDFAERTERSPAKINTSETPMKFK